MSINIQRFIEESGLMPQISDTEKAALEAGSVWIDGDLFSGSINPKKISQESYPKLSPEERAFMDGPVNEVCSMVDDWQAICERSLPDPVWNFLKKNRFFGLAIPKEHGGLGFSALMVSTVLARISTVSSALSTIVLIPNSVGPGELILNYGNEEQKTHYLPKLAAGTYLPCFALTELNAGSDAASIRAEGIVFKGEDGKNYLKLNFKKRYITLAPIANLIGLAFHLQDPENYLGLGPTPGITCALIPADVKGLSVGRYHDPMGMPFPNGPIEGKDVIIPTSQIIGGESCAGKGWKMLMEALSCGRALSLPAQSTGGLAKIARVTGAYAVVREQFHTSISSFAGVQEPLARICAYNYMLEAARVFTCGSIDQGHHPSVISAIMKLRSTEMLREAMTDAMDILGGKGIFRGPSNPFGLAYQGATIGVTVEGANILTRTLIIFGQGAIRCHPYALKELNALERGKLGSLCKYALGHFGFFILNCCKATALSLTRAYFASKPHNNPVGRYYQKLKWASVVYAVFSDLALFLLGSKLKKKGKLTGRYADLLSWMYFATAILKRFDAEKRPKEDLALVRWSLDHCFSQIDAGFRGILANFEVPVFSFLCKFLLRPWSQLNAFTHGPSDNLGSKLAKIISSAGSQRDRLTELVYKANHKSDSGYLLDQAMLVFQESSDSIQRIRKSQKKGLLAKNYTEECELYKLALQEKIISEAEYQKLLKRFELSQAVTQVDDFDHATWSSWYQNQRKESPVSYKKVS